MNVLTFCLEKIYLELSIIISDVILIFVRQIQLLNPITIMVPPLSGLKG